MKNKYIFTAILLAVILFAGAGLTALYLHQQEKDDKDVQVTVVTSFYPMYIAAENIVGDCENVTLENLSEPQTGCLHDYQLTSADMKLLSTADIFIINGGGIESFLSEVAEQYPDLTVINACENIELSEDNAHAWMSMEKYMIQVQTICDRLAEADTEHEEIYRRNAEEYIGKVESLRDEYSDIFTELSGRPVVLFHEAYEYLADELGLDRKSVV